MLTEGEGNEVSVVRDLWPLLQSALIPNPHVHLYRSWMLFGLPTNAYRKGLLPSGYSPFSYLERKMLYNEIKCEFLGVWGLEVPWDQLRRCHS